MKKKVCVDAGHCKLTPGKRAFDGSFFEWEFNLDVANRIKKILLKHGVDAYVQYIEHEVPVTELRGRINAINKDKPDVVVSIHANAFGSDWNDANGWEVYSYNPANRKDESTRLARLIQKHSIPSLGLRDRGVKPARGVAGIVMNTTPTAVLVEHGFYTNIKELKKLKDGDFRQRCAIADSMGILEYLGIEWKGDETVKKEHWAQSDLDALVEKGMIKNPETHKDLDAPVTKGLLFALLNRTINMCEVKK